MTWNFKNVKKCKVKVSELNSLLHESNYVLRKLHFITRKKNRAFLQIHSPNNNKYIFAPHEIWKLGAPVRVYTV